MRRGATRSDGRDRLCAGLWQDVWGLGLVCMTHQEAVRWKDYVHRPTHRGWREGGGVHTLTAQWRGPPPSGACEGVSEPLVSTTCRLRAQTVVWCWTAGVQMCMRAAACCWRRHWRRAVSLYGADQGRTGAETWRKLSQYQYLGACGRAAGRQVWHSFALGHWRRGRARACGTLL